MEITKAQKKLGWELKASFSDLVEIMVESDIELAKQEKVLLENNLISPTWESPTSEFLYSLETTCKLIPIR